jgi:hypothetical protein
MSNATQSTGTSNIITINTANSSWVTALEAVELTNDLYSLTLATETEVYEYRVPQTIVTAFVETADATDGHVGALFNQTVRNRFIACRG